MKVAINTCYGGFSFSEKFYEKLIEYGVPVKKFVEQVIDPETRQYLPEPLNDGEVLFDRTLSSDESDIMIKMCGKYWGSWVGDDRSHPLMLKIIEELGEDANGQHSKIEIIEIPDDVEYTIDDYDGMESIHENHRMWG